MKPIAFFDFARPGRGRRPGKTSVAPCEDKMQVAKALIGHNALVVTLRMGLHESVRVYECDDDCHSALYSAKRQLEAMEMVTAEQLEGVIAKNGLTLRTEQEP